MYHCSAEEASCTPMKQETKVTTYLSHKSESCQTRIRNTGLVRTRDAMEETFSPYVSGWLPRWHVIWNPVRRGNLTEAASVYVFHRRAGWFPELLV